ncbi:hypothetical protein SCLCIDRAFT_964999 [Scleroderma citrinum Foug A]|uniref:Uncharacterized protein n=1 Tax=Scleroderma citrinum Foug A TaxID=1036808 RepID=A0A0C3DWI3_9AGAM|nr:hypothetical protein SCLCIDRAFT_964999 [Scleroderma citrinum Foug A]
MCVVCCITFPSLYLCKLVIINRLVQPCRYLLSQTVGTISRMLSGTRAAGSRAILSSGARLASAIRFKRTRLMRGSSSSGACGVVTSTSMAIPPSPLVAFSPPSSIFTAPPAAATVATAVSASGTTSLSTSGTTSFPTSIHDCNASNAFADHISALSIASRSPRTWFSFLSISTLAACASGGVSTTSLLSSSSSSAFSFAFSILVLVPAPSNIDARASSSGLRRSAAISSGERRTASVEDADGSARMRARPGDVPCCWPCACARAWLCPCNCGEGGGCRWGRGIESKLASGSGLMDASTPGLGSQTGNGGGKGKDDEQKTSRKSECRPCVTLSTRCVSTYCASGIPRGIAFIAGAG